jgi:sensor c-di-GMP phosphodiesterase-like protein
VETQEQAHALRGVGCQLGQGHLFAMPMPPAEFTSYLSGRRVGARSTTPPIIQDSRSAVRVVAS